jgi:3-oxoacyl-[acyl-carrier-protein] synthase III
MLRTRILGTGFVTGEHKVTNAQLAGLMDTSDEWIRERSGVEERYYVEAGTTTTALGLGAARKAIADAGIAPGEIDYIVFATMTPDHFFPGCGGLLQKALGLGHVPALDIRQQCTGFIYGLQVGDALIRSGQARTVLLVGAEVHSGFMPWTSRPPRKRRPGTRASATAPCSSATRAAPACSAARRATAGCSVSRCIPTAKGSRRSTCPRPASRSGRTSPPPT